MFLFELCLGHNPPLPYMVRVLGIAHSCPTGVVPQNMLLGVGKSRNNTKFKVGLIFANGHNAMYYLVHPKTKYFWVCPNLFPTLLF